MVLKECVRFSSGVLQIGSAAARSALLTVVSPTFAVAAIVAIPLCMTIFGACLAAASVAFKWTVAGAVVPGVHRYKTHTIPCMPQYPLLGVAGFELKA